MSIFQQHSHTNAIYESDRKLGLLRWENGALLIRYRINTTSKSLFNKLTFTKIYW